MMKPGLELAHSIEIDNRRPVNAHELLRIQLLLQHADAFSQQVRLTADVQLDILTFGFNPINLVGFKKENATA